MPLVWLATEADAPVVAALLGAFRDWWGRDEPSDESLERGVRRLIGENAAEYLLAAEADDAPPAGVCQLRYRHALWREADDCVLEDLFVLEEARRAGLGRSLVDAAVQRARERGCVRIELDANDANPAAVALYEGAGFSSWSEPPGGRDLVFRRHL
jgi:ribosomal protein S18 acetylase RimI-like enzyme